MVFLGQHCSEDLQKPVSLPPVVFGEDVNRLGCLCLDYFLNELRSLAKIQANGSVIANIISTELIDIVSTGLKNSSDCKTLSCCRSAELLMTY